MVKLAGVLVRVVITSVALLVLLLTGTVMLIKTPWAQQKITHRLTHFVEKKTGAQFTVGSLYIDFPKKITLKNGYLYDKEKKPLAGIKHLQVDLNLIGLLNRKVELKRIWVEGATVYISRKAKNSAYNFQFLLDAFASKSTEKKNPAVTNKPSFTLLFNEVVLGDVVFQLTDAYQGIYSKAYVGSLQTKIDKLNFEKGIYRLHSCTLNNSYFSYALTQNVSATDSNSSSAPLIISCKKLITQKLHVDYHDKPNEMHFKTGITHGVFNADEINLTDQRYVLTELSLTHSLIYFSYNSKLNNETYAPTSSAKKELEVKIKQLNTTTCKVVYHDWRSQPLSEGFDPAHLTFYRLNSTLRDVALVETDIRAQVQGLSTTEHQGFKLNHFSGLLSYTPTSVTLSNFKLFTPYTRLQQDLTLRYKSVADFQDKLGSVFMQTNLKNCKIGKPDLVYFNPSFKKQKQLTPLYQTTFDLKAVGTLDNLLVQNLQANAGRNTRVKLNGRFKNLTNPKKLETDIPSFYVKSNKQDASALLPDSLLPANFKLPETFALKGKVQTSPQKINGTLAMSSSRGDASLKALVLNPGSKTNQQLVLAYKTNDLDLGYLTGNTSSLGRVSLEGKISGSSLSQEGLTGYVNTTIKGFNYNAYTYSNIVVVGKFNPKGFKGSVCVDDPNVVMYYNGQVDLSGKIAVLEFDADVLGANLMKLNFAKQDIRVRGKITSRIRGSNVDNINGYARIDNLLFFKNNTYYPLDTVKLTAQNEDQKSLLYLQSNVADVKYQGNISFGRVPELLKQHVNRYFHIAGYKPVDSLRNASFDAWVNLKNATVVTELLFPKLEQVSIENFKVSYRGKEDKLTAHISVPYFTYDKIKVDKIDLSVNSDRQKMTYALTYNGIKRDEYYIEKLFVFGDLKQNRILNQFLITDEKNRNKYLIATQITSDSLTYKARILPNFLILNYQPWSIPRDNELVFGKDWIKSRNMVVSNGNSELAIMLNQSKQQGTNSTFKFKNVNLQSFTNLVTYERGDIIRGNANGRIELKSETGYTQFLSDMAIRDLYFRNDTLGNLLLTANNPSQNVYNFRIGLQGNGNDLNLEGDYLAEKNNPQLNAKLRIPQFNLATVDGRKSTARKQMKGIAIASLDIRIQKEDASVLGNVQFKDAEIISDYSRNTYKLANEEIQFTSNGVRFNNLLVLDSAGAQARINGIAQTSNYRDFKFDLTVNAKEFTIINARPAKNKPLYGKLVLSTQTKITGSLPEPVIVSNTVINNLTDFTYVNLNVNPAVSSRVGIIEFVPQNLYLHPIMTTTLQADSTLPTVYGLVINTKVQVDTGARLNIVPDPVTGDKLFVKGSADLEFELDKSGAQKLNGRYELNEGGYTLTFYELVRKDFEIGKNSTILFTGNPLEAVVDIKAIYNLKTSPGELISDQQTDQQNSTVYRDRLPFQVLLNLKGEILSPVIDFDLSMPTDKRGALDGMVYRKLQQINENEEDVNKQVFSLLSMNRFVPEDPLQASEKQGSAANLARSSASKLLSDELNKLSDRFIKGVDLDLGLDSQEGSEGGTQTDLDVKLSKNLFNERLTVELGSNVNLEGESGSSGNKQSSSDMAGDFAAIYKLTKDGRLKVKGYREEVYGGLLDGSLIETGISFILQKNFNQINELMGTSK